MQNCIYHFHHNQRQGKCLSSSVLWCIYLEQWKVLGHQYYIPWYAEIFSPEVGITCKASLGFVDDWYIWPNKDNSLLKQVATNTNTQTSHRRRSLLISHFRIEIKERDRFYLRVAPFTKKSWTVYIEDYLQNRGGVEPKESCDYSATHPLR